MANDAEMPDAECPALQDKQAWQIIFDYAENEDVTMPEAMQKLQEHLQDRYREGEWKSAFDAVFEAEDDIPKAVAAVHALAEALAQQNHAGSPSNRPFSTSGPARTPIEQLDKLEKDLMGAVHNLKERNRIIGTAPTLEELLNPVEEDMIGDSPYMFPGGEAEIVEEVKCQFAESDGGDGAASGGNGDEHDHEDEEAEELASLDEAFELCQRMEKLVLQYSDVEGVSALDMQRQMRRMRAHVKTWSEVLLM